MAGITQIDAAFFLHSKGYTPPPEAYGAEPFSLHEFDTHPDAARLWATIMVLRDYLDDRHLRVHEPEYI